MSAEQTGELSAKMAGALDELRGMIQQRYPSARFRVGPSPDDPSIVHLTTEVDVEDTDEVADLVIDRMMEMQIAEDLPIYVIPVRPSERVAALMRGQSKGRRSPVQAIPTLERELTGRPTAKP